MNTYTEAEIHSLIARFERGDLPKPEWTHEAHLAVAIWYLWHHDLHTATNHIRQNITDHNVAVGTGNSDTDGYHETITLFWVWVAGSFLKRHTFNSVTEACNALILSDRGSSRYPLIYYSPERLFSVQARYHWTEPDLRELV